MLELTLGEFAKEKLEILQIFFNKRVKLILRTWSVCFVHYCETLQDQLTPCTQGWEVPRYFYANNLVLYLRKTF